MDSTRVLAAVACGLATSGCGAVLGIDPGEPFDAGAPDGAAAGAADAVDSVDAAVAVDQSAPGASDGANVSFDAPGSDADPGAGAESAIDAAVDCAGPSKRAFLSSTTTNGAISDTGAAGVDARCQQLANAVKLGGTWRAWISDDKTSPSKRFTRHAGPYVLVDRATVVACGWSGLTSAPALLHPIDRTEDGGPPGASACGATGFLVWTDTLADGTPDPAGSSCAQWTDGSHDSTGSCGCTAPPAAGAWSLAPGLERTCDAVAAFYCFEQ